MSKKLAMSRRGGLAGTLACLAEAEARGTPGWHRPNALPRPGHACPPPPCNETAAAIDARDRKADRPAAPSTTEALVPDLERTPPEPSPEPA